MYLISKKTSTNPLKRLITQYTNSQNIKKIVYNTIFLKLCKNVINLLYYRCNHWEILGEGYMGSSILFFFNFLWVCIYFKIKIKKYGQVYLYQEKYKLEWATSFHLSDWQGSKNFIIHDVRKTWAEACSYIHTDGYINCIIFVHCCILSSLCLTQSRQSVKFGNIII